MRRFIKPTLIVLSATAIGFVLYNFFWFSWSFVCYTEFTRPLEAHRMGAKVEYRDSDDEQYEYVLEMPNYLTYHTGRMRVSRLNVPTRDVLEITPQPFSKNMRYTALLYDNGQPYVVEIDEFGAPLHPDEALDALLMRRGHDIRAMLDKAGARWRL